MIICNDTFKKSLLKRKEWERQARTARPHPASQGEPPLVELRPTNVSDSVECLVKKRRGTSGDTYVDA